MRRARGLLVAVLAAAALAAGCSLPGRIEGPVELTATFSDVGDLVPGHSVQVADVRVGSVMGIELNEDYEAEVRMSLKDGLELPANSRAILRTTSLLGEKFIEIRVPEEGAADDVLQDGDTIEQTEQAPELEFVAEEAVDVLAGVAANDLAAMIETGGIGFAGRAVELGRLIEDLATVSSTLADQTGSIVTIIDGLGRATSTLAGGDERIDTLLLNLSRTTEVLADNRELTLQTLRDLTRLAEAQNDLVLEPHREDLERQIQQLDAILALVAERRGEVATLVDWLDQFVQRAPLGIPDDFAQIYAWFDFAPLEDGQ